MHGHTGGGHVGGGGHMPPAHHQPHQVHHQVHSADAWTSSDSRPHMNALATRIRNRKMAATTAIGVVLALLILLLVFI
jgi:phosphatidylethanolamine-binding protein (PEBP) family uncharacterized protein